MVDNITEAFVALASAPFVLFLFAAVVAVIVIVGLHERARR